MNTTAKSKPKKKRKDSSRWKCRKNAVPLTERASFQLPEAADYLSLSITTVRRLIKRGLIQTLPAIRHIVIARSECDRFIQAQHEMRKLAA